MADVHVAEELWSTGMQPEGILERWFVADGALVRAGEALHDIASPTSGRLTVLAPVNEVIDPGCIIAEVHA